MTNNERERQTGKLSIRLTDRKIKQTALYSKIEKVKDAPESKINMLFMKPLPVYSVQC